MKYNLLRSNIVQPFLPRPEPSFAHLVLGIYYPPFMRGPLYSFETRIASYAGHVSNGQASISWATNPISSSISSSSSCRHAKNGVCLMSAKGEGEGEGEGIRSAVNPFVAVVAGMALLSSDPAVTFATQSARDALVSSASPASTLVIAEAGSGDLKSLLGEVCW